MEETKKIGFTSNVLKIIVIIVMLIDHIGMYMHSRFTYDEYYLLRSIGRMAMPIFAYLLVQGFFYTKDLKRFIYRVFCIAIISQIVLLVMGYVNEIYYYNKGICIPRNLNVLFSYTLSLILIADIDKKQIIHKLGEDKNLIIRINIFIIVILAYLTLDIEFGISVPFLFIEMYAIEKLFMGNGKLLHKREFNTPIKKTEYKLVYLLCIFVIMMFPLILLENSLGCKYSMLGSIVLIGMYNGNRGIKNKFLQYVFYAIYPIQHILLYIISI